MYTISQSDEPRAMTNRWIGEPKRGTEADAGAGIGTKVRSFRRGRTELRSFEIATGRGA